MQIFISKSSSQLLGHSNRIPRICKDSMRNAVSPGNLYFFEITNQNHILKKYCILRVIITLAYPSFVCIHAAVTVQRVITTFSGNFKLNIVRKMIFQIIAACITLQLALCWFWLSDNLISLWTLRWISGHLLHSLRHAQLYRLSTGGWNTLLLWNGHWRRHCEFHLCECHIFYDFLYVLHLCTFSPCYVHFLFVCGNYHEIWRLAGQLAMNLVVIMNFDPGNFLLRAARSEKMRYEYEVWHKVKKYLRFQHCISWFALFVCVGPNEHEKNAGKLRVFLKGCTPSL